MGRRRGKILGRTQKIIPKKTTCKNGIEKLATILRVKRGRGGAKNVVRPLAFRSGLRRKTRQKTINRERKRKNSSNLGINLIKNGLRYIFLSQT